MGGFSSFSWLNNIHYFYTPHLLYSLFIPFFISTDEHLGCFHYSLLWTMLQWTWGAQISLWDLDFSSFGYIPRSEIAGSYGSSGLPRWLSGKESACNSGEAGDKGQEVQDPWVKKFPWRRAWQPTPVFLPGESHGQRSLAGYSLWSGEESDTTEAAWHICTVVPFLIFWGITYCFLQQLHQFPHLPTVYQCSLCGPEGTSSALILQHRPYQSCRDHN